MFIGRPFDSTLHQSNSREGASTGTDARSFLAHVRFVFVEAWQPVGDESKSFPDNVLLLPRQPNLQMQYARARLVVVPSTVPDAAPRVISEAGKNGIPVLGSTSGIRSMLPIHRSAAFPHRIPTNGSREWRSFFLTISYGRRPQFSNNNLQIRSYAIPIPRTAKLWNRSTSLMTLCRHFRVAVQPGAYSLSQLRGNLQIRRNYSYRCTPCIPEAEQFSSPSSSSSALSNDRRLSHNQAK